MKKGPQARGRGGLSSSLDSRAPRLLSRDHTAIRATLYWFLCVALFVGAFGPMKSTWTAGPALHFVLETVTILLAFVVGALALVRFYSKKRGTFLFIGTGFLATGLLDSYHALISSGLVAGWSPLELQDLSAWSFTASGAFLSLFLFVSWLAWRREGQGPEAEPVREVPVYLTAVFLTVLVFAVFDLFPVTQALYPELRVHQPAEFFPAFFFLLALGGYLGKGHWRFEAFEHWLVIALLIAFMGHAAYMPFSREPYDADFVAAHVLRALSYGAVLIGLMASVYVTFRREEEAAESAREANSALAREIDVRRQAERVLQESEERLQDFLENAHDLIQSVDPDGRLLYVNRAWKETLGYSEQALEGITFFDLVHPSCLERVRQDFQKVLGGTPLPHLEVDFVTADGKIVKCAGSANCRFQDGKPQGTRSLLRDITDQVAARRELEAFQANLQALVENTGDAIFSVDRSLRLITFNTAFAMALEARTGREPRVGDLPHQAFPPADAAWYGERYRRALRGEAFSELRDEEIGGQIRSYELFFNPIREAMGITGVAVFGKDVTARRRTQVALRMAKEEAERANQAKSQFLANMSHELRTPLNSVIGFTNILLKNRGGGLAQQELGFLQRILANGRHLLELINEVLDLAKIEAGKMELEVEETHLDALVQETIAQMEGQVRDKPLVLRGEVPRGLAPLRTDPGKLKQVIINLVGNALKFTERGEVVVQVIPGADGRSAAAVAVRDTGIGISPDRLNAIFEAFQQADGTTSRRYGGTGLGLTISRSLCQLLGFDLSVESEVGKGSVFTILIAHGGPSPAKLAEEELMAEALAPIGSDTRRTPFQPRKPPTGEEKSVLVIDDDPDSRLLMAHYLEEIGCRVRTAPSAAGGLRGAREEKPDLITLDLMMPGMTGWEALKELKEDPELREVPVVIISVLAREGERAQLLGAVDLLNKPVERDDLLRVLKRHLDEERVRSVLVVEDDPDTRAVLSSHLEEAGLQVRLASNGSEAEAALAEELPDLILLDLLMPVMDGATFLRRLRGRPEHLGLPVIVVTARELEEEERTRLLAQASGIVPKGEGFEQRLEEILSRLFPLPGAPGHTAPPGG